MRKFCEHEHSFALSIPCRIVGFCFSVDSLSFCFNFHFGWCVLLHILAMSSARRRVQKLKNPNELLVKSINECIVYGCCSTQNYFRLYWNILWIDARCHRLSIPPVVSSSVFPIWHTPITLYTNERVHKVLRAFISIFPPLFFLTCTCNRWIFYYLAIFDRNIYDLVSENNSSAFPFFLSFFLISISGCSLWIIAPRIKFFHTRFLKELKRWWIAVFYSLNLVSQ